MNIDPKSYANIKIESLAYALSRARAYLKVRVDYPEPNDQPVWAIGILADIDRALEGTIYAPARAEDTE